MRAKTLFANKNTASRTSNTTTRSKAKAVAKTATKFTISVKKKFFIISFIVYFYRMILLLMEEEYTQKYLNQLKSPKNI